MYSRDVKSYQEKYISTMTPSEMVTLLYSEIIKNLNKSIAAISGKKIPEAHQHIVKAQDILLYMIKNLDLRYEIGTELLKLYDFMYDALVKANINKDAELIKRVLNMVTELKATWIEAEKRSRAMSHDTVKCI
ncbi:MAG TPA: flagellar export chaperone FliS [Clostridiales bacterium]|nr:flagellar export chaperone FliS [Clostridiales bacterium]